MMKNRYGLDGIIPEAISGEFEIKHQPDENSTDYMATCLYCNGTMIMSDRAIEHELHSSVWETSFYGNVIICGLGLGYVHNYFLTQENVEKIIVVEKNKDVIDLVWNHCNKDDRFELIHDNAETWEPTDSFDFGWFDSWIPNNDMSYEEWVQYMESKYKSVCDTLMFWKDTEECY